MTLSLKNHIGDVLESQKGEIMASNSEFILNDMKCAEHVCEAWILRSIQTFAICFTETSH